MKSPADYVIIATKTNYDEESIYFSTRPIKSIVNDVIRFTLNVVMIINRTIPVGFIESSHKKIKTPKYYFPLEFLARRQGAI